MALRSQQVFRGIGGHTRHFLCAVFASCLLLAGCVTLPWQPEPKEKPPEGKATQIVTTWRNQVFFLPDSNRDGKPTPCLVGHLLLFGQEGPAIACPGKVIVKLLRNDKLDSTGEPKHIESWEFKDDILQQLVCKDPLMGWGYVLPLAWGSYEPNLRNITLCVSFTPKDGYALYAPRSKVSLGQGDSHFSIQNRVELPNLAKGGPLPPVAGYPTGPAPASPYANPQAPPGAYPYAQPPASPFGNPPAGAYPQPQPPAAPYEHLPPPNVYPNPQPSAPRYGNPPPPNAYPTAPPAAVPYGNPPPPNAQPAAVPYGNPPPPNAYPSYQPPGGVYPMLPANLGNNPGLKTTIPGTGNVPPAAPAN